MSDYYCHQCASSTLGFVQPGNITSLSATSYQLGKFVEHTAPASSALSKRVNSIFDDPSYSGYKNYIINTAASGWVEQDKQGRINLAWYAGKKTGVEYHNGAFFAPADGVKVALSNNTFKIHGFPFTTPSKLKTAKCKNCGASIPY
jgi:hypothetical protein